MRRSSSGVSLEQAAGISSHGRGSGQGRVANLALTMTLIHPDTASPVYQRQTVTDRLFLVESASAALTRDAVVGSGKPRFLQEVISALASTIDYSRIANQSPCPEP